MGWGGLGGNGYFNKDELTVDRIFVRSDFGVFFSSIDKVDVRKLLILVGSISGKSEIMCAGEMRSKK